MLPGSASLSDPAPPSSPVGALLSPMVLLTQGTDTASGVRGRGLWAGSCRGLGMDSTGLGLQRHWEQSRVKHSCRHDLLLSSCHAPFPLHSGGLPDCPDSSSARHELTQPHVPTAFASASHLSSTGGICGPIRGHYPCLACSGMCGRGPHSKKLLQALQGTRGKDNINDALVQLLPLGGGLCVP